MQPSPSYDHLAALFLAGIDAVALLATDYDFWTTRYLGSVLRHLFGAGCQIGELESQCHQVGWQHNRRIGRIKRAFKWAVAEELIPPSVFHGLQAVAGCRCS